MRLRTFAGIVAWVFFMLGTICFVSVIFSLLFHEKKQKYLSHPKFVTKLKAFTWIYQVEILGMIAAILDLATAILIWTI